MPKPQTDASRERAKALLDMVLRQAAELDNFLADIKDRAPPDEFNQLRTIVGKVMGSVVLDAINPIVEQYPDLRPDELNDLGSRIIGK